MHGHISANPRRASISLKITVVGGSIAGEHNLVFHGRVIYTRVIGLASAYQLQKAGHDVMVLEKGDGQSRVSYMLSGLVSYH